MARAANVTDDIVKCLIEAIEQQNIAIQDIGVSVESVAPSESWGFEDWRTAHQRASDAIKRALSLLTDEPSAPDEGA